MKKRHRLPLPPDDLFTDPEVFDIYGKDKDIYDESSDKKTVKAKKTLKASTPSPRKSKQKSKKKVSSNRPPISTSSQIKSKDIDLEVIPKSEFFTASFQRKIHSTPSSPSKPESSKGEGAKSFLFLPGTKYDSHHHHHRHHHNQHSKESTDFSLRFAGADINLPYKEKVRSYQDDKYDDYDDSSFHVTVLRSPK